VLAAALVVVWVQVVKSLTPPSDQPKSIGQPEALVWDAHVFTTAAQLKAYLEARGLSYARWSARHPTAFGAPAPATARHTSSTKKAAKPKAAKPKPKSVGRPVAAPAVTATQARSLTTKLVTIILVLGGVALAASALVPARIAPVVVQRLYGDSDRRMMALAAASARLVGVGVSFLFS
jgi:hypothetical protein